MTAEIPRPSDAQIEEWAEDFKALDLREKWPITGPSYRLLCLEGEGQQPPFVSHHDTETCRLGNITCPSRSGEHTQSVLFATHTQENSDRIERLLHAVPALIAELKRLKSDKRYACACGSETLVTLSHPDADGNIHSAQNCFKANGDGTHSVLSRPSSEGGAA